MANRKMTRKEIQKELKNSGVNVENLHINIEGESEEKKKKKKSFFAILFLIESLVSFALFVFLGIGIAFAIALIPFLYYLILSNNKKKGKKRPKGTVFFFILYLIIIVLGLRTFGVLNSLVSNVEINEFYVVTLKENEVNKVKQIDSGSTIALGASNSYNTSVFPKKKFKDLGYDFNYTYNENEVELANELLNKQQKYIIVESPKSDDLKSIDNFKEDTKVIGHFKERVKIDGGNKNIKTDVFTVLLTGVDTRSDSISTNSRSDSLMLVKINPKTQKSVIVSIPRDAYIDSSCTGSKDKITHSSLNGMNCLTDDVESLFGTTVDYYIKVNFSAVIEAIDAVGGIEVDVEKDFCGQDENDRLNSVCLSSGTQKLTGTEALSYARERHSFADGDYARAKHQQQVIDGFLKAVVKSGPLKVNKLMSIASSSARTNFTSDQLKTLVKLVKNSDELSVDGETLDGYGQRVNIPYWGLYGTSVQIINDDSLASAIDKLSSI